MTEGGDVGMTEGGNVGMTKGTWGVIGEEVEAEETVRVVGGWGKEAGLLEFGGYPRWGVRFVAVTVSLVVHNLAVVDSAAVVDLPKDDATVF